MRFVTYDQSTTPAFTAATTTAEAKMVYDFKTFNEFEFVYYKTYDISLNFINQLFDIGGKFYNFAFTR